MLKKLLSLYIWICGLLTVGVTFFVFLYILAEGEAYLSPSFILDFPSGTPLGTAGGYFSGHCGLPVIRRGSGRVCILRCDTLDRVGCIHLQE